MFPFITQNGNLFMLCMGVRTWNQKDIYVCDDQGSQHQDLT